jgi:hypothetical protein
METDVMTWGIPTSLFLQFHVVVSLIAIASGLVALYGLLTGRPFGGWIALFLATTVLTGITGFPLPPFGFTPARAVGVILLVLLAMAVAALYAFRLAGAWRWIYIGSAVAALYLNVFVGVTGLPKAAFPAAAGADAIGAPVSHRAACRARGLHRVRRSGDDQVSPRGQGRDLSTPT